MASCATVCCSLVWCTSLVLPNKTFSNVHIQTPVLPEFFYRPTEKLPQLQPVFLPKFSCLKSLLNQQQIGLTIKRLANQVLENHAHLADMAILGIQPRGVSLSDRLVTEIRAEVNNFQIPYGKLDITFYRDDLRKGLHLPSQMDLQFSIEGKNVVLVDDVLHTGRTIRAALDALMAYGRPAKVELLVLIDRRYSRELPIQPDYTGKSIDSIVSQKVKVFWHPTDGRDEVVLLDD